MAPPLPEASHPSKTTHSGGPISPPICPPSTSRCCRSRPCASGSSVSSALRERRSERSTSSRRPMGRQSLRTGTSASSPAMGQDDGMARHTYRCPMRWSDMDAYGHVNNVVFLTYLEEARVDMLFALGSDHGDKALAEGVLVAHHEI